MYVTKPKHSLRARARVCVCVFTYVNHHVGSVTVISIRYKALFTIQVKTNQSEICLCMSLRGRIRYYASVCFKLNKQIKLKINKSTIFMQIIIINTKMLYH